jgi:La-related protein 7
MFFLEIPLEVFMNFNKLRALTEDLKEIAKVQFNVI